MLMWRLLLSFSTVSVTDNAVLICLQITIDVMHIGRLYVGSETLSLLIAAQCLLLWFRLQFFIRYPPLVDNSSLQHTCAQVHDAPGAFLASEMLKPPLTIMQFAMQRHMSIFALPDIS